MQKVIHVNTALDSRSDLNEEIETLRRRMVALGNQFGFLHPEVMACSQRLDQLLLDYYARDRKLRGEIGGSLRA